MNRKTTLLAILVLLAISLPALIGSSAIADSGIGSGNTTFDSRDFPLPGVMSISARV